MIRMCRILKSWGLHCINCFSQLLMQECVVDVKLSQRPLLHDNNSKNHSDFNGFYDRTQIFLIVLPSMLVIPFNQSHFKTVESPIWFPYNMEYPFATFAMAHKHYKFFWYCCSPMWFLKCLCHTAWLNGVWDGVFVCWVYLFWLVNVVHWLSSHWMGSICLVLV